MVTITDMFCGAGGSSTGAVQAGATVVMAINHWKRAIETHNTNHPQTKHALTDLFIADPHRFPRTDILIASPECTSHTLAKGKKRKGVDLQETLFEDLETPGERTKRDMEERSRCTMWTPLQWAETHNYAAVIMENVVDIHLWGPFEGWKHAWDGLGYRLQFVYLNSMFAHPTPQSRDRVYIIATKKKNPLPNMEITPTAYCRRCEHDVASIQSWKNPSKKYGKYKKQYVYCCPQCGKEVVPYYYAAANAIDWSQPAPRIGNRKKPLEQKTIERIAYGLQKFYGDPFVTQVNKTTLRAQSLLDEVLPTQTGDNGVAMVQPFSFCMNHSQKANFTALLQEPGGTQTTWDDRALVVPPAFILDHIAEYRPRAITDPLSTLCASGNHQSLATPPTQEWIVAYQNDRLTTPEEAIPTVTTLSRHALLTHDGPVHEIAVEDCGFRMLTPDEIKRGMAFPDDYILTGTRREQVKQAGNAVTPPAMKLLVERTEASLS